MMLHCCALIVPTIVSPAATKEAASLAALKIIEFSTTLLLDVSLSQATSMIKGKNQ